MEPDDDWRAKMPALCQAGRSMRGGIPDWSEPCNQRATQYLVSDEIVLPRHLTVSYDCHEVLEAWLCDWHLQKLLEMTGWSAPVIRAMSGDGDRWSSL